ncbi:MAG: Ig-like domain repeat protein [Acidobacteriota bacterium]
MRLRLFSLVAAAGAILGASNLSSQVSAVAPRIVRAIDDSQLIPLRGNVTALAQPRFDRGEADPAMQMTSVRLVLSRSKEQEAALEQFMAQQLDKSSPNYHHWLTPQQFGTLYGPADSDIAAIVAWLESHSLQVQPVSPGRTNIAFSGSVSAIEAAFHTQIHSFNADGREFYSNITDPKIPAALASVVSGVAHLNTLQPRSHAVQGQTGTYDPQSKSLVPVNATQGRARPDLTSSGGSLYIVAADGATIYDTPNSFNANFSSGTSYTGSGVTIGIGGEAMIQAATVQNYRSKFIGDSTAPTITNVIPDSTYNANAGALGEAYLDTEVAGAMAPGATIHYYVSSNLDNAIDQALTDNTVDIFSLSFGLCELLLTTSGNQLYYNDWQQAAAQGIAVTVSAGDSGSAGCEDHQTEQSATYGYQVSGFASTPYNIAVGGTDMYGLLAGFSTYVNSTSGTLYRSAKSYIPESTWNSSVQSDGKVSANVPYVDSQTSKTNVDAGSGGPSSCTVNTTTYVGSTPTPGTCSSFYAKPTWQRGAGVPQDGARDIPDVSLMGGLSDGAAWLVCSDSTGTVNGSTVTANCSGTQFYFQGFGGTSASAPAFAGILALVQQKMGGGGAAHRLGADAAKTLYDLFDGAHGSAIFHDITQGNNSVPCTSGTPNCAQNTAGNDFITGYDTGVGYDLATGLGSVDVTQMINYWGATLGTANAPMSITPSATSMVATQSLSIVITLASSGSLGTPTGAVSVTSGSYNSGTQNLDSTGRVTIAVPPGSLAIGTASLAVHYSGDSNYAAQDGTSSVTVTAATPTLTMTPNQTSLGPNANLQIVLQIAGTTPAPTGTAQITGGGYTSGTCTVAVISNSAYCTFNIPANSLANGSDVLTAHYSGDSVYVAASATTTVTVNHLNSNTTAIASSTNVTIADSVTISGTVTGTGATPTGAVDITGGGYVGQVTLTAGAYSVTIPPRGLQGGVDVLTISYPGDSLYESSSASVTVNVAKLPSTITVTPAVNTLNTGQALQVGVQVSGAGGTPSGTVTLTSGTYNSGAVWLSNTTGAQTVTIPANTLPAGSDTITTTYSGDGFFTGSIVTSTVTVVASAFGVTPGTPPAAINPGGTATTSITIATNSSYSGTISLACAPGANNPPNQSAYAPFCTVNPTSLTLGGTNGNSATATVSITTTAPSAQMQKPRIGNWMAGGATALALLVFFGIPARRRRWRNLLGIVALLIAFGGFSACGGGSGGGSSSGGTGGGGTSSNPGTAAGSYTFTVTGTGNPSVSPAPTATINLTIN